MKALKISENMTLPLSVMGEASQIYGIRGSGKTNTAKLLVEALLSIGEQCVILDPTNAWWGLKSSADGKEPGFPIYVLGGEQGDRPLGFEDGHIVADWVVRSRASVVLSLRHLRKGQQKRFALDFLETMYHLKGKAEYQTPVLVVIDEASTFIPQNIVKSAGKDSVEAQLVGAVEDIVRRGRVAGFGVCLVDQRPASVNKQVSTQAPLLIAHKIVAPTDRKALLAWTEEFGDPDHTKTFIASLQTLGVKDKSEAWVWWPADEGTIFQKIKPLKARTYDSSRTPGPGEKVKAPTAFANPNLEELDASLENSKSEAKANDPKELRAKIKDLEKQLAQAQRETTNVADPHAIAAAVDQATTPLIRQLDINETILNESAEIANRMTVAAQQLAEYCDRLGSILKVERGVTQIAKEQHERSQSARRLIDVGHAPAPRQTPAPAPKPPRPTSPPAEGISQTQQRILNALAWYESIGNSEPTNLQVGAVALIDSTGGHFSNVVGPLSTNGLVVRGGGTMRLTDAGRSLAQTPEDTPTLDAYHDVLRSRVLKVRNASRRTVDILNAVIAQDGEGVSTEDIGKCVGIDHMGGHFSNTIGPLATLGLIERRSGMVYPTSILFPEGLVR